jgi:hypothetical protein
MRKDTKVKLELAEELRDGLLKAYSQVRLAKGDKYAYGVALDRLALFLRQSRGLCGVGQGVIKTAAGLGDHRTQRAGAAVHQEPWPHAFAI